MSSSGQLEGQADIGAGEATVPNSSRTRAHGPAGYLLYCRLPSGKAQLPYLTVWADRPLERLRFQTAASMN